MAGCAWRKACFGIRVQPTMTGWQPAQPKRDELPASVRGSPGGYRSYHFWHSGYHGGK